MTSAHRSPTAQPVLRDHPRAAQWEAALAAQPEAEREAARFLVSNMPDSDFAALDPSAVLADVHLAFEARASAPWGGDLPQDIFFNYVLPYASLTEPREPWRREFMEKFQPLVRDCRTPGEAAMQLNANISKILGVRYTPEPRRPDQGPQESIRSGQASCTGLSILLVNACRAVAVPARVAGIPRWPHKLGNHTWVEIWSEGRWRVVGAFEPSPLDEVWFTADAALADPAQPMHAIWATSWAPTGERYIAGYRRFPRALPGVHAVNVTARYLRPSAEPALPRIYLILLDEQGRRMARKVTVRRPDGGVIRQGTTRGEQNDLNDYFWFELPDGDRAEIEIARDSEPPFRQTITGGSDPHQFVVRTIQGSP
ncbi:MAG: transglutaminase domain-containing protein [Kiritimatiellae bacterium]|nr:transglutaminase domain-containing protein [Kiritimatiellia bacterium]